MKIFWLAHYPVNDLEPELKDVSKITSHSAGWIVNLAKSLAQEPNIELHIIVSSAHIAYNQKIVKHNITFHVISYRLPFFNKGFPDFFPYDSFSWYRGLIKFGLKILNKSGADIVHAHGIEKGYSLLANKSGLTNITSIQGSMIKINKISPSFKAIAQIPIEKYCIRQNLHFGCRTNWDYNLIKLYNPTAKIYTLPEMINSVFFEKKWCPEDSRTIVFIGSIIKRKGIEILINAIVKVKEEVPTIKVVLIGGYTSKYYKIIQNKINKLKIEDNINFRGTLKSVEIANILSSSSLFVLPSLIDNSPNSLAEAMAVGMPCIASDVGGIPSMIEDGINGLLFKSKDSNELAKKILLVLNNEELSFKLAHNAKKIAYERNHKDNVVAQTINVYESILKAN